VPGSHGDLFTLKSQGADIRVVYSPLDCLKIATANPDKHVVFFAIGFETTAPANAMLVHRAVERIPTPTAPYQPPAGILEVSLWILLSISAGICEEIVFRGYLQNQFRAVTRSMAAAMILQGAIFGVAHSYQGWKQVIVIAALGVLYGALAAWRRNLLANMIAHAWSDIYEGWASFAFFGRV